MLNRGVVYALASAILFGVSTPLAKGLVGAVPPLMLAGLLYAGSGVGLLVVIATRHVLSCGTRFVPLPSGREWLRLDGAIFFGGLVGPVLVVQLRKLERIAWALTRKSCNSNT